MMYNKSRAVARKPRDAACYGLFWLLFASGSEKSRLAVQLRQSTIIDWKQIECVTENT